MQNIEKLEQTWEDEQLIQCERESDDYWHMMRQWDDEKEVSDYEYTHC